MKHPFSYRHLASCNFGRILRSFFPGLILCSVLCACRPRKDRTIAVIPATTGAELWEAAHGGAAAAGRESGFRIHWNGPTRDDDVAEQIALLEGAIDKRNSAGLIVAPTNYLALVGSVQKALSRQIPTVIIRSPLPIPPGHGLSYIVNDDREVGRLAAERIGAQGSGKGKVAVLGLNRFSPRSILRAQAFRAELAKRFSSLSVIDITASSNAAEIQQKTQEILVANPEIVAILTLDVTATEGAWAALTVIGTNRRVKLVGCGQELDLMAAVRRGDIDSIIVENTYEMGSLAVRWIAAQDKGQSVPGMVELKPVLVTRENIDNPEVQRMLSEIW